MGIRGVERNETTKAKEGGGDVSLTSTAETQEQRPLPRHW
jgi:hypothetical protein